MVLLGGYPRQKILVEWGHPAHRGRDDPFTFGHVLGGKHKETHEDTQTGSDNFLVEWHDGYRAQLCANCGEAFLVSCLQPSVVTCGSPECGAVAA